jgi:transcriptional regulator with XRE-family HTH domain|nr:MAG TPA: helix-turn-helix domain protein [Caudoviricetes sp.]
MNERIHQLRKALGLTLEEFGTKVGVGKSAISKIERGENNLSEQMFKSICREWNVNEEWLRTGEGEMFVELTRDEQIASFIGSIQANVDDSFKKRFISMLSTLDEPEWELLEKMALKLYKKD